LNKPKGTKLEQVWFSGVHSNVGGGYPKQGMAHVPLYWMMNNASKCKLKFKNGAISEVRHAADVTDKMYDSRAGTGLYYRYLPRNIATLCGENGINKAKIHASVFDRITMGIQNYAPGFLPANIKVVTTKSDKYGSQHSLEQIANHEKLVGDLAQKREPILKIITRLMNARRVLYFLFLGFNVFLIAEMARFSVAHNSVAAANGVTSFFQAGIPSLVPKWLAGGMDILISYFNTNPWWGIGLVTTPLALFALHKLLKDRMNRTLTGYWWEYTGPSFDPSGSGPTLLSKGKKGSAGKSAINKSNKNNSDKSDKHIND